MGRADGRRGLQVLQNKLTGENWIESTDESGRKFYHNTSTGESSRQPLASSLRASSEISSATDKGVRSRVARRCGSKCCCMLACCVCIALLFGGVAAAYMILGLPPGPSNPTFPPSPPSPPSPSPAPYPPGLAPHPPPPSPPNPPPPPLPPGATTSSSEVYGYYVDVAFSLSGDVGDYGASELSILTSTVAVAAGVSASAVKVQLSAASVRVSVVVEFEAEEEARQAARILAGTATDDDGGGHASRAIFASAAALRRLRRRKQLEPEHGGDRHRSGGSATRTSLAPLHL